MALLDAGLTEQAHTWACAWLIENALHPQARDVALTVAQAKHRLATMWLKEAKPRYVDADAALRAAQDLLLQFNIDTSLSLELRATTEVGMFCSSWHELQHGWMLLAYLERPTLFGHMLSSGQLSVINWNTRI